MDKEDLDYLIRLLQETSALALGPEKEYLLEARLLPVARSAGLASTGALVARLRLGADPALKTQAVEAMAIHETYFFREQHVFEALRTSVIPYLIKSREPLRTLSIWSAACAKGQEPYSLAMLLRENFPELQDWSVNLIASDFSSRILAEAKRGVYSQLEVNRGLPASLLLKYFGRTGLDWKIDDPIARTVRFEEINLRNPWPPTLPRMDVILICNALIYFDVEVKKEVLDRAYQLLKPDGLLFLGSSETTFYVHDGFQRVEIAKSTACYQRRDAPGGPSGRT